MHHKMPYFTVLYVSLPLTQQTVCLHILENFSHLESLLPTVNEKTILGPTFSLQKQQNIGTPFLFFFVIYLGVWFYVKSEVRNDPMMLM